MTAPKIEPALTADQWRDLESNCPDCYSSWWGIVHQRGDEWERSDVTAMCSPEDVSRHALAALALYGQPFGFTQEDIEELEGAISNLPLEWSKELESIRDRIKALLPPEPADAED